MCNIHCLYVMYVNELCTLYLCKTNDIFVYSIILNYFCSQDLGGIPNRIVGTLEHCIKNNLNEMLCL